MRPLSQGSARRLAAVAVAGLISVWGIGTSAAQEHHGDHHGGHGGDHHGGHDTTTTTRPPSSSSTTRPPSSTTTTRPPSTTTTRPPGPGVQTRVIRYGPWTVQPGAPNPDGTHGHGHASGAQIAEKPCNDCYIVGMYADLVHPDGTRAGYSTDVMLHHMVMFNSDPNRQDATCATSLGRFGQRFFASGDERTPTNFPDGYGYRVGTGTWGLLWELMSTSTTPETAAIEVTYEWVPATTPGMRDVEPVWMDIDQCADSEVSIPAGRSSQNWTWTVNRPGDIVGIAGHVHDHGINLEIRNDTTGELICNSVAGYGEEPIYIDHHGEEHISSMSGCGGRGATEPVATVRNGERVTITSHYDAPAPIADAMGISVAYIAQAGGGSGGEQCVTATNQQHTAAGRATAWLIFAWARGSNEYLGLTWATTSLRQSAPGTWTRVASC